MQVWLANKKKIHQLQIRHPVPSSTTFIITTHCEINIHVQAHLVTVFDKTDKVKKQKKVPEDDSAYWPTCHVEKARKEIEASLTFKHEQFLNKDFLLKSNKLCLSTEL